MRGFVVLGTLLTISCSSETPTEVQEVLVDPTARTGAWQILSAASSGMHSCAVAASGAAHCWGLNHYTGKFGDITLTGQLGEAVGADRATPTPVVGGLTFRDVSVGAEHSCGVIVNGTAYCWGDNHLGPLGDGGAEPRRLSPGRVLTDLVFDRIYAGRYRSCALTAAGAAYCWGDYSFGMLGQGPNPAPYGTVVPVSGGLLFSTLTLGFLHTCGLTTSGAAYCWGSNINGELGNGLSELARYTPVAVSGGLTFASIAAQVARTCGVTRGGDLYCWGDNYPISSVRFVDVPSNRLLVPTRIDVATKFIQVTLGAIHSCALTEYGIAHCWGINDSGQLGDGSRVARSALAPVALGLRFRQISAGMGHSCGITTDGDAYCWGEGTFGRLGNGDLAPRSTPTKVGSPSS